MGYGALALSALSVVAGLTLALVSQGAGDAVAALLLATPLVAALGVLVLSRRPR
jgi:hypothetical protein